MENCVCKPAASRRLALEVHEEPESQAGSPNLGKSKPARPHIVSGEASRLADILSKIKFSIDPTITNPTTDRPEQTREKRQPVNMYILFFHHPEVQI